MSSGNPEAQSRVPEQGHGRDAARPQDIPAPGWRDILWRVANATMADRVLSTAGSVAFFVLLAIFPGIATLVSLYGLFADPGQIIGHLAGLAGILPDGVLSLLMSEMTRVAQQGTGSLGLASLAGLLISLWSANSGVATLFDALNVVYKEHETRSLFRFYATTFLFTLGSIVITLAAFAAVVVVPVMLNLVGLGAAAEMLLSIARWPILFSVVVIGLALLYRYGPRRRSPQWQWVSWGSVLAAALWLGASMLFSLYVASFDSYNRVYGSLGAGVGFMTWIWLSVVIMLLGGELNSEMEHQTARDTTVGAPPEKPMGERDAVVADTLGKSVGRSK
jgi:membrane protein